MNPTAPSEAAARAAVKRGDWHSASQLFTTAANLVPIDPHGVKPAELVRLQRQAHVARSMHERLRHFDLERAFVKPAKASAAP